MSNEIIDCPYHGNRRGEFCYYKRRYNPKCNAKITLNDEGLYACQDLIIGSEEDVKILNLINNLEKRPALGQILKKCKKTK